MFTTMLFDTSWATETESDIVFIYLLLYNKEGWLYSVICNIYKMRWFYKIGKRWIDDLPRDCVSE